MIKTHKRWNKIHEIKHHKTVTNIPREIIQKWSSVDVKTIKRWGTGYWYGIEGSAHKLFTGYKRKNSTL